MKIKDVEKLTGLSQRSIRLYEEKGLINPSRDEENRYRSYTDDDLEKLKLIRVLRYFDFSIEEIVTLFEESDPSEITNALSQKAEQYADVVDDSESKAKECKELAKKIEKARKKNDETHSPESDVLDEYIEMMDALDDEDAKTLKELEQQLQHPSIGATIFWTFVLGVPIIVAIFNGFESKLDIILALVSTVLITLDWVAYIKGYKRRASYQKKRDKGSLWVFLIFLIAIAAAFLLFAFLSSTQELYLDYMLGDKWVFYEDSWWTTTILIIVIVCVSIIPLLALFYRLTGNEDYESGYDNIIFVMKHKYAGLAIILVLLYISLMQMAVVTDDSIRLYDSLHPRGRVVELQEVESVETGFNRKGTFYYKVITDKGDIKFSGPYVNESAHPEYVDEDGAGTYQELVDFDEKLMSYGIPKSSDVGSIGRAIYSDYCMDKFTRILKNEPQ